MPLYQYECKCGRTEEVILYKDVTVTCPDCRIPMERQFSQLAMVRNKGEGGYPSRQKYMRGTAPFSNRNGYPTPWLDKKPELINETKDWCTGKETG